MMGPIIGRLYNLDVENEQFWIDLETMYLPNSNVELATANDWRAAYIAVKRSKSLFSFLITFFIAWHGYRLHSVCI